MMGEDTQFLEDGGARAMGRVGLDVLSGPFNSSCLGPFPKVTPTPSPQDRCPRKGDPEQAHPGSSVGMWSKHLKAV